MLRTATFLNRRGLFSRLANPGKVVPGIVQNKKKFRPLKGMSTCEGEESPVCSTEPSLMDYCPVPEGCWKEKYDKDNKEAYRDLALGFASLILSILVVLKNGVVKKYDINLFEPKD